MPCNLRRLARFLIDFVHFWFDKTFQMSILRKGWDIIFAFLFQIFIFEVLSNILNISGEVKNHTFNQELPNAWSISGALLVALAIFLNGAKKFYVNNSMLLILPDVGSHRISVSTLILSYRKPQTQQC